MFSPYGTTFNWLFRRFVTHFSCTYHMHSVVSGRCPNVHLISMSFRSAEMFSILIWLNTISVEIEIFTRESYTCALRAVAERCWRDATNQNSVYCWMLKAMRIGDHLLFRVLRLGADFCIPSIPFGVCVWRAQNLFNTHSLNLNLLTWVLQVRSVVTLMNCTLHWCDAIRSFLSVFSLLLLLLQFVRAERRTRQRTMTTINNNVDYFWMLSERIWRQHEPKYEENGKKCVNLSLTIFVYALDSFIQMTQWMMLLSMIN